MIIITNQYKKKNHICSPLTSQQTPKRHFPEFTALSHFDACASRQSPGPGIMATYVDILKSEFPEIDCEVFDYITGESRGQAGTGGDSPGTGGDSPGHTRCLPDTQALRVGAAGRHTAGFSVAVSRRANELTGLTVRRDTG